MKIVINKYYIFIGGAILILLLFINAKYDKAILNTSSLSDDNKQQTEAAANDTTAKNIEKYLKDTLKDTTITLLPVSYKNDYKIQYSLSSWQDYQLGEFVKKIIVSKAKDGGYNVDIDINHPTQFRGSSKTMASIYVPLYKNNTKFDVKRISISSYIIAKDKYGNINDKLTATSSLSKEEADKYNWNLGDDELINLMDSNINFRPSSPY